ncbi:MAG: hypothetical protein H7237_06255, partial [Alkalinema sp. FL-bin-369]|nr:hypothetical protein [Leptolyngbyaceae cyanobacterium LF-bin-369]
MYAGAAKGNNNNDSNKRRPGNEHSVTTHAVLTPIAVVPTPTPSINSKELPTYVPKTVLAKCCQIDRASTKTLLNTTQMGNDNKTAIIIVLTVQLSHRDRLKKGLSTRIKELLTTAE